MGNMEFFKRELTSSLGYHFKREFLPKALKFLKEEVNIFLDKKIKEVSRYNDNPVKPQLTDRKGKDTNSVQRVRPRTRTNQRHF